MFATFTTELEAKAYADEIQAYLCANRPGYQAERWSVVTKHQAEELYAVPLPPEYIAKKANKKLKYNKGEIADLAEIKLPEKMIDNLDGWLPDDNGLTDSGE